MCNTRKPYSESTDCRSNDNKYVCWRYVIKKDNKWRPLTCMVDQNRIIYVYIHIEQLVTLKTTLY